ncbi:MAG TPA: hypothetical protein P5268_08225 [Candidatus Marinimicrobia bacterium]|nr:hypothetical protein [Candidatus Neomarinimicrobiota bacterium]HRS52352.1 hypothetical protein [Candidatus Neomarinimicrobiota bacterium]HRU92999.1 hypothetical protein [Candidatus Neomarinimicrobiota bacterium]
MQSAPISLFEKIPEITQALTSGRSLVLVFNLECLTSSRRWQAGSDLTGIQRHIHWIADLPDIITVILSDGPLNELETLFDNHKIILAPNNGTEIYAADFSWNLPDLNQIRQELTDIYSDVRESLGAKLQPEYLGFSQSELWLKVSPGAETVRESLIEQFKLQKPAHLRLTIQNNQTTIIPLIQWDRGQAVQRIMDLVPHPTNQAPLVIYFGVEENDEAAFRYVNQVGLSVIIHSRVPRSTEARYFLRNTAELSKFLFWVHSR